MVGGGGWFRRIWNTVCFHTYQHCYLRYFLLKETLQIRMVEHGMFTEGFFFSTIRQCTRFVRTRERIGMREKKELFSLFPHPNPSSINPSRFFFPYAPSTISKEKQRACEQATIGDKIVETLYLNRVISENNRIRTPPLSPPFKVGVLVVFYRQLEQGHNIVRSGWGRKAMFPPFEVNKT